MRRYVLALAMSVLALGAEPAAATPPKPPVPLEMSGVADVLEAPPLDPTSTTQIEEATEVTPVEGESVSSPEQEVGNEPAPDETGQSPEPEPAAAQPNDSSSDETVVAPPADPSEPQPEVTEASEPQQSPEPEPAAAQPNDSSSDETVVAPAADPSEPQPEVTEAGEPQQAAEPEVAPANSADSAAVSNSPDVQSDSGPTSESPAPASQSAAAGQSPNRPTPSTAPAAGPARSLQVWEPDAGGEPSVAPAAPPTGAGTRAGGAGVAAVPEREPDLVPAHAGGLPSLLPVELISEIELDELFGERVSETQASPASTAGVVAASIVKRQEARAAEEAVTPKPTGRRPEKPRSRVDRAQPEVHTTRPKSKALRGAPTARRGPDFIVAAQRAAPGAATSEERPPWLITLLALLATAISLAAITIIVLWPHVFRGKTAPPVPRPREPDVGRNEQAGIRYRE